MKPFHADPEKNEGKEEEEEEEEEEEQYVVIPPNGGWGWVIVFCAFYCNLITDGIQLTFGTFLQEIATEYKVEKSKISLIGSLMFGVHLLVGPICAGLSNVFGIRPITAIGSLVTAFALSMCYFSPHFGYLYIFYGVLGGFGLGLVYMNTIVITSLYFTTKRVFAVAIVVCGTGVGTVTFAFLGNELLKITNWRVSFLIEAALAGTMFPAALTFRPLKPKRIVFSSEAAALMVHTPSLTSRQSKISRHSRFSKMSKVSIFERGEDEWSDSTKSRRATVYIPKSVNVDSVTRETIVKQLNTHFFSRLCACCCRKCRRNSSVLLLLPEQIEEEKLKQSLSDARAGSILKMDNDQYSIAIYGEKSLDTLYSKHVVEVERKKHICNCKPLQDTVKSMLDFKLMRSCAFIMYCVSGMFGMSSLLVVLMYERDRSIVHGYSADVGTYLVAALGAANTILRLFLGGISLINRDNRFDISVAFITCMTIGGLAIITSGFWHNLYFQFVTCCLYALGMAGFAVYRPGILVLLVGTELVINATGIALLFMGMGSIISPPLSGLLMEWTSDYDVVMYAAGSMLIIAAALQIGMMKILKKDLERLGHL